MPYVPYYGGTGNWENLASTDTPIQAAALNHAEQGIITAQSTAETAQTQAAAAQTTGNNNTAALAGKVNNASGQSNTLWIGTQAQYDAIAVKSSTTLYAITT